MDLDLQTLARSAPGAGLVGALISLRFAPGLTWAERAVNVVSGTAIASYVGPSAADVLMLHSDNAKMGVAFMLGFLGISLAGSVLQAVREIKLAEILGGWLRKGS